MRLLKFFRQKIVHLAGKLQKTIEGALAAPLFRCLNIQGFIFIHIQHMKKMLGFRSVQRAIQGKAMVPGLAKSVIDNHMMDKHAPHRIIANVHVAHFRGVSANCYSKFLPGRQTIINPVRRIFGHSSIIFPLFFHYFGTLFPTLSIDRSAEKHCDRQSPFRTGSKILRSRLPN